MGLFSGIKKKFKKIFKGVKKTFGKVGAAFGKLMQNKWIKYAAIAGALVFTAGAASAMFPALGSTSLMTSLSANGLTSGLFTAGSNFAGALGVASQAATTGAEVGSALTGATSGTSLGGATGFSLAPGAAAPVADIGLGTAIADAGAAVGAAVPASSAMSTAATLAPEGAGILSKVANVGKGVLDYTAKNPGSALLAGNIIESMSTPSDVEQAKDMSKYQRGLDWRGGVNNLTGEVGATLNQYRDSLSGLLTQASQLGGQGQQQAEQATGEYAGQLAAAPVLPTRPLNMPVVNYPTASGVVNPQYPTPRT